ncbi:MAG: hypothetical protein ACRC41_15185 [Sarcina sp.]
MLIIFISKNNKEIYKQNSNFKFGKITLKRFTYKISANNTTYKVGTRLNTICFNIDSQNFLPYGRYTLSNYYCGYKKINTPYISLIIQLILSLFFMYFIYLGIILGNIYIGVGAILILPLLITYIHIKTYIYLAKKSLKEDT